MKIFASALVSTLLVSTSALAAFELPAGQEAGEVDFPAGVTCVKSESVVIYNWGKLMPVQYQLLANNHGARDTLAYALFAVQKGFCEMGYSLTSVVWTRSDANPKPTAPGQKITDFSLVLEFSSPSLADPSKLELAQSVLIDGAIMAGDNIDPYKNDIFSFMIQSAK